MKIENIRSEFKVIFVDEEYASSNELFDSISEVGYQTQIYPTLDSALLAIKTTAPHILVLNYSKNETGSDRFLGQVRKMSPETQVILMVGENHQISAIMKNTVGEIFDYVSIPVISSVELLIRLDRAAKQLYLKFENEQLRKRRAESHIVAPALKDMHFEESESNEIFQRLQVQFVELAKIRDQEELIKKYIFQVASFCGSMPVMYLKFLPAQSCFVSAQGIWTPLSQEKNLGFKVQSLDDKNLIQLRDNPEEFRPLREFMTNVFQIDDYGAFLHFEGTQVRGLTVVFNKPSLFEAYPEAHLYHSFFESIFSRNESLKELAAHQTLDISTGLLNKKAFGERLHEEISRARRIKNPVSMLKIQIDNFDLLSQKYGEENIFYVVKAFAKSMKKNFRTLDILARTASDEFCFVLPHTGISDSLVKAEKVRRAFAQSQFPFIKIEDKSKLSLSIGVSEYPSISSDAETLQKSCEEALQQVKRNQGNRVASWYPEPGFKPDFNADFSANRNIV